MQLYFILCSDENFNNRKGGPFGVPSPDDMKSKSHANLMREDEDRMRWQQPPVSSPTDNRSVYFLSLKRVCIEYVFILCCLFLHRI